MSQPKKLLFMCSQNIQRSLTAERLYEGFAGYAVKSAGTEISARTPVTKEHIEWAEMVFVMESEHLEKLQDRFGGKMTGKKVVCLDMGVRSRTPVNRADFVGLRMRWGWVVEQELAKWVSTGNIMGRD